VGEHSHHDALVAVTAAWVVDATGVTVENDASTAALPVVAAAAVVSEAAAEDGVWALVAATPADAG
jgi:hypothetical protein